MLCLCRLMFVYYGIGLMLCPLADVIAFFSNHRRFRADVITLVLFLRLMLLPCGRWNSHWVNFVIIFGRCYCHVADVMATGWITSTLVLGCLTEPHPICEADGICLYFCLGMDCSP